MNSSIRNEKIVGDGETVTTDTIREINTGRNRNAKILLEVFDQHNKQMQELANIHFAPGTMEHNRRLAIDYSKLIHSGHDHFVMAL